RQANAAYPRSSLTLDLDADHPRPFAAGWRLNGAAHRAAVTSPAHADRFGIDRGKCPYPAGLFEGGTGSAAQRHLDTQLVLWPTSSDGADVDVCAYEARRQDQLDFFFGRGVSEAHCRERLAS